MAHHFRARLRRRETLIGTLVSLPGPETAELLAGVGLSLIHI